MHCSNDVKSALRQEGTMVKLKRNCWTYICFLDEAWKLSTYPRMFMIVLGVLFRLSSNTAQHYDVLTVKSTNETIHGFISLKNSPSLPAVVSRYFLKRLTQFSLQQLHLYLFFPLLLDE